MQYSYDEIVERMNNKFFELSGYDAERFSDIGIRIKLLAGEIFSLSSEIDWIKKQMFPNTASGKQLDLHAQQRGLERRKGNKAVGQIVFKLDTPLEYTITIPKGTICTTSDGTLNFVTIDDSVIMQGGTFAYVDCEAEQSGVRYNVPPKSITTIVTYFSVGITISNASSFTEGTDDESDEELRQRIIYSMRNIPNGANKEYYISLVKSVDGIQSAKVIGSSDEAGKISIYVGGRGCIPSEEAYRRAQIAVRDNKAIGVNTDIIKAQAAGVNVDVSISTENGYDFDTVQSNVKNAVTEFFNNLSVGEAVTLTALGDVIFHTDGVSNYVFNNMSDKEITLKQLAILSKISVSKISNAPSV